MENSPQYITDAKFINEKEDVEEHIWPRDPTHYIRTNAWQDRIGRLLGVISQEQIYDTLKNGELYSSITNSVTFVKEFNGVALYVIVSGELNSYGNSYPTNPSTYDYTFKAVTVWPYVYDAIKAMNSDRWSSQDIKFIEQLCQEESGQPEVTKH
jgi:hypothetical protein